MCDAVEYSREGRHLQVFFTSPWARLPVLPRQGRVVRLTWGRRRDEPGTLPRGGWAGLDDIQAGRWDAWQPRPVRLAVRRFRVRDIHDSPHWHPVTAGQWLQGLLACHEDEQRVYVVTLTPRMPDAIYERWPRLVTRPDSSRTSTLPGG